MKIAATMDERTGILIVEDDRNIVDLLRSNLLARGYRVTVSLDGSGVLEQLAETAPDIVLVDLMLPGADGFHLCRKVREKSDVGIIVLSARRGETDKVRALNLGADDYLTKPFSMRELMARVHALLRRVERAAEFASRPADEAPEVIGDLSVSRAERRVWHDGAEIHLTPTEFTLLVYLVDRPRTICTREQLLDALWGWADGGTRTIDSHVRSLRRKLGADLIRTVHGVGYALETS